MPTLVTAALVLLIAPQTPGNRVEAEATHAVPRSRVVHGLHGRLVLPAGTVEGEAASPGAQDPQVPPGSSRDFLKDVMPLRRSRFLAESEEAAVLQRLGRTYDRIPERCLELTRSADPDVMHALMRVLQTYGRPEHAGELEFLLLTRPLRSATEIVTETMASLAREKATERLFSCLTASRSVVRHHAAHALESRVGPEDAEQLLALSRQGSVDVQMKALRLLGRLPPTPEVRTRLVAAMSEDPQLADSAVEAVIEQGPENAADLQQILRRPAIGRATGYAAIALAGLEEASPGTVLVTPDMAEYLVPELDVPDPFQRSAVAIALAGLAWRSEDTTGAVYRDRQLVEGLLEVVAPTQFVAHLALLRRLAHPRLVRLAGRDLGTAQAPWREWWDGVAAEPRFVGARREVPLTIENAAFARLTWHDGGRAVVLRGERTTGASPADDTIELVVGAEELVALVQNLRQLGFMSASPPTDRQPDGRAVVLVVDGVVARSDAQLAVPVLDRMEVRVDAVTRDNRWQLYRDPDREPDAVAFWRAERKWLDQHPDPVDRARRLKDRIIRVLAKLPETRVPAALNDLFAVPDLRELLTEEDGLALVEAARAAKEWDAETIRILELALLAPGEKVWTQLVAVALARDEAETGDGAALGRIFGLAGADRVLAALDSESELVQRVAMDEIASLQDLRAAPRLLATALDADAPIPLRRTAVFGLGRMRAIEARAPLIGMLDQGTTDADLRRTTWIALARIGGDEVFPVLQRAFPSPDDADRRAIVQALGAMRHPKASRELGNIFALRGNDVLGTLALEQLRQQGDLLASPALIPHLDDRNQEVRQQCAMLLGDFQHPAALPELLVMLTEDEQRLRVISLIAGVTGQNVTDVNDRVGVLKAWLDLNRDRAQGDWFLQALAEAGAGHSLRREQLMPMAGTAAVPELTRLVMELEQPWLRSLAGRMLRVATGEDYGVINPLATEAQRLAICDRYRFLHDSAQAASGR